MPIYRIALATILSLATALWSNTAVAANPTAEPAILVATPALQDQLFGASVVVVTPLASGEHIGFFLNRPTRMKLSEMFPDHTPSKKVTEPIFLGFTENIEALFALVQRQGSAEATQIQLAANLFIEVERARVNGVIENEHQQARFFAGIVVWQPGELVSEIRNNFWYVQDVETEIVLRKSTEGMWEDLVKRIERSRHAIAAMNATSPIQRAPSSDRLRE